MNSYSACSSTDNFLSPIPISDWLIFCWENLMLHKKRTENDKTHFFDEKQKNAKKVCVNKSSILYSELTPLTQDTV